MKNKKLLGLIFGTILILGILNIMVIKIYQNYTYKMVNNIISNVAKNYPELELKTVIRLIEGEATPNILDKYGIKASNLGEIVDYKEMQTKIIISITLAFFLVVLIIFVAYLFYRFKIKREIKMINGYLQDILKGTYEVNIANYNEDELSILKNDIVKVAIKLKELSSYEHKERIYLMNTLEDISHQLKTPLTALMVTNDILKNNKLTKQEQKDFLNKEAKELEKMEWLITTLLKYSKLDSGMVKLKKEEIEVEELIKSVLDDLSIAIELKEIEVFKEALNFDILCDINWTREALTNILKNAIEHLDNKGVITIAGEDNPIYKRISITDNGSGINKSDIKKIFTRFYSNNSNKNSVGIGLNMAKLILEKENAKIEVDSVEGEYTTFVITFIKKQNI